MRIVFDDWATCYQNSNFEMNMDVVPRVGETIHFHPSRLHTRFFNESPYVGALKTNVDGFVEAEVNAVDYVIGENSTHVEVDLNFVDFVD